MSLTSSTDNSISFIKILIEILTLYDKVHPGGDSMGNPTEFVKNHVCELKIFLSADKDLILSIFYDICLLRVLLNEICKNKALPKTQKGIVHLYLMLFYSTPANLNTLVGSLLHSFKSKKFEENFLQLLQRNDLIEYIWGLLKKIYNDDISQSELSDNTSSDLRIISKEEAIYREYVEKEIEDRKTMFKNLAATFKCLRQTQNLNKINYSIEGGHHILMDYSQNPENYTNSNMTNNLSTSAEHVSPTLLSSILAMESENPLSINKSKLQQSSGSETNSNTSIKSLQQQQPPQSQKLPVKMTIAQLLRQGAQIEKKSIQTEKIIQDLCTGSLDPKSIELFLVDVRKSEEEFELCEIERKHLLGRISLEEARLAKLALQKRNRDHAIELKKQNQELLVKLSEYQEQEEIRIREIFEKNHLQQENLKLAQAKVLYQKRATVKNIQEHSKQLAAKSAQKQKEELERKINLIKQIKALEPHVSKSSFKTRFGNNVGLMSIRRSCEMSLSELKNAVAIMRLKISNDIQQRREKIQSEKQRQQKLIQETVAKIEYHKNHVDYNNTSSEKMTKKSKNVKMTPQLIQLRLKLEQKKLEVAKIENQLCST